MIWSNLVAGSALMAIAAAGVTRSARPRMSATMISLPSPFILAKGAVVPNCAAPKGVCAYMAETPQNCQRRRWLWHGSSVARWLLFPLNAARVATAIALAREAVEEGLRWKGRLIDMARPARMPYRSWVRRCSRPGYLTELLGGNRI